MDKLIYISSVLKVNISILARMKHFFFVRKDHPVYFEYVYDEKMAKNNIRSILLENITLILVDNHLLIFRGGLMMNGYSAEDHNSV